MEAAGGAPPLFLIVRSSGGPGHAPRALREAVEEAGIAFAFAPVRGLDGISSAIDDALEAGYERLIIAGPDSAVSRTADALLVAGLAPDVTLGVIPAGLSRDIAASLGVTSLQAAVAAAVSGSARKLDVGRASTGDDGAVTHFLTAAAAGWMPPSKVSVPAPLRNLPADAGWLATAAMRLQRSPARSFTLTVDGIEHDGRYAAVSMHNIPRWQGGLLAAPGASPTDALLDVLRWDDIGRAGLLRALRGQLRNGVHLRADSIARSPGRVIEVSSPRPTMLIADGRPAGNLPAKIDILPGALRFLTP
jgi:diacylglycerol kinase (ATP)